MIEKSEQLTRLVVGAQIRYDKRAPTCVSVSREERSEGDDATQSMDHSEDRDRDR